MKNRIIRAIGRTSVIVAVLILSACGSGSEGEFTDAINQVIQNRKTCFSLQNNHVTWPIRMRHFSDRPLDPILAAMQAAGYLKITKKTQQQKSSIFFLPAVNMDVISISPTEEAKGWWDAKDGYCVGTREVVEIQEWTEPTKASGQRVVVKFTWHLDAPSWADRPEFKNIKGLGEPINGQAVLQKTNKGWRATIV